MDFFKSTGFKIYLAVVAGASILAFGITAAVLLPGYLRYQKNEEQKAAKNPGNNTEVPLDFLIPKSHSQLINPVWESYYSGHKWTESELSHYWKDPDSMLLDYLEDENASLINDILKKYE